MKLARLAELVDGRILGDPELEIEGVAGLTSATPEQISFIANPRYSSEATQSRAGALITRQKQPGFSGSQLLVPDPYHAFARIHNHFHPLCRDYGSGVHIDLPPDVELGAGVYIAPGVVLERDVRVGDGSALLPGVVIGRGVSIGRDCILHSGTVVREGCRLGDGVILQPRVVIGSDGFGFAPDLAGGLLKITQAGGVRLEDLVEIGAGSTVDRGTSGDTLLGEGVKIDNLVQIAHNVTIGPWTVIAAQTGISGSTTIGSGCQIGGQVGIVGHLRIGNRVRIGAQSGVTTDLPDGAVVSGYPAREHTLALRIQAAIQKLPELRRTVSQLKREIRERDV